jgi:hypothetical protein
LELGPGGVLAGLVGRIRKGTPIASISNVATLDQALTFLSEEYGRGFFRAWTQRVRRRSLSCWLFCPTR